MTELRMGIDCAAQQVRRRSVGLSLLGSAICLAVLAMGAGCAARRLYRPSSLPEQFSAPPIQSVSRLDLSGLVTQTVSSDLVDCGDVLEVTISADYEGQVSPRPVRVADDGTADSPLVGRVAVAGLKLSEAERAIADAAVARQVFAQPSVNVRLVEHRTNTVTVLGAVKEPKTYHLPRGQSNLLAALVMAGGLTEDASPEVEIRRPAKRLGPGLPAGPDGHAPLTAGVPGQLTGYDQAAVGAPQWFRVNLIRAVREGQTGFELGDGDVVMVNRQPPHVIYVDGLVNKPGQYEMPREQETRLLDALAMAGGRSLGLADKVWVVRHVPGEPDPVIIEVRVRQAKRDGRANIRLAPGDVVSVEETPTTFVFGLLKGFFHVGSTIPLM